MDAVMRLSAKTLRAIKRKAQARDHALPAGEERLLIRPAQLKGARVIWTDVDLIDEPPRARSGQELEAMQKYKGVRGGPHKRRDPGS
jgi:hypothetical protein